MDAFLSQGKVKKEKAIFRDTYKLKELCEKF